MPSKICACLTYMDKICTIYQRSVEIYNEQVTNQSEMLRSCNSYSSSTYHFSQKILVGALYVLTWWRFLIVNENNNFIG